AVGIARLDDLARAAALHRRAVIIEVQAPLLLVRVVAGAAAAAEDLRDVILIGDLSLGRVGGPAGGHEPRERTDESRKQGGGEFRSHGAGSLAVLESESRMQDSK